MSGGVGVRTRPGVGRRSELSTVNTAYPAAYARCPKCSAAAGEPCTITAAGKLHDRIFPHWDRKVAESASARAQSPARQRGGADSGAVLSTVAVPPRQRPAAIDDRVDSSPTDVDAAGPPPYYCELF